MLPAFPLNLFVEDEVIKMLTVTRALGFVEVFYKGLNAVGVGRRFCEGNRVYADHKSENNDYFFYKRLMWLSI